ncbi:MAG: mechanosensitive ion channel [Nitrosomonadales bacterium]|nr:MAG: mechanosensitive ion channel [Nitrosomonadales bacterium]
MINLPASGIKLIMLKIKAYCYISLLVLPIVLPFSVMAKTNNIVQTDSQQTKHGKPQEIQQTDASRGMIKEDVIKDRYSEAVSNLKVLIDNLQVKDAEIKNLSKKLNTLKGGVAKVILDEIIELKRERKELKLKIESFATGVDIKEYRNKIPAKFNFAEEIEKLLQPMIHSLNSVTQDSREIEEFKQAIEKVKQRKEIAITATHNLNNLLIKANEKTVKALLGEMLDDWKAELKNINNDDNILSRQLENKLQSKVSVLSSVGEVFSDFFKNRGINFVLGIFTFFTVFLLLRFSNYLFKKIQSKRKDYRQSTFERLAELIFHILTILASIMATLFIFNLRNDWLLLGISVLFLLAIGWVLIKTLPTMLEQLMLLLNLGSVREGGRVVMNGIPWKVKRLHFYTHLVNPDLSGGSMHLPVRQLVGLVSRPAAINEEWFPTSEGEWVKMDDKSVGQVIYQSPEMVQVRLFGGNQITYSAESFLALNPMNLSHGYRIQMVFGIDYKYQAECTTTIPNKMTETFRRDLIKAVGEDSLVLVRVDFFLPNNSSLDFEYEVFLKGSAAHLYEEVERTMIYSFANVCNENHWEIPFQQITLHQVS